VIDASFKAAWQGDFLDELQRLGLLLRVSDCRETQRADKDNKTLMI
jgi:hypothetical protein